jgi:hypothetical protein
MASKPSSGLEGLTKELNEGLKLALEIWFCFAKIFCTERPTAVKLLLLTQKAAYLFG